MSPPDRLVERLDRVAATAQAEQRMPSLCAATFRDGEVLWRTSLGTADVARSEPATPEVSSLPVPTLLLLGGVVVGIALAVLCRVLVGRSARRRARRAERRLRAAVDEVADELVVAPIEVELDAYRVTTEGLQVAAG